MPKDFSYLYNVCVFACLPLSGFAERFNNSGFSSWNCGLHHLQIKSKHNCTPITYTHHNKKRSKSSSAATTKVLINEEKTKKL